MVSYLNIENPTQSLNNNFFSGKRIVFTGKFNNFSRNAIKNKAETLGAIISSQVSAKTDYLVVGLEPGSKLKKAESFSTKIINEDEFLKYLEWNLNFFTCFF